MLAKNIKKKIVYLFRVFISTERQIIPRFFASQNSLRRSAGFIVLLIFFAGIIVGVIPGQIFDYLAAEKGSLKKINLYASGCNSSNSGWQNSDFAQGEPEINPNGILNQFNARNSAFYSGGNENIECERFMFLREHTEPFETAQDRLRAQHIASSSKLTESENNFDMFNIINEDMTGANSELDNFYDYEDLIDDEAGFDSVFLPIASSSGEMFEESNNVKDRIEDILASTTNYFFDENNPEDATSSEMVLSELVEVVEIMDDTEFDGVIELDTPEAELAAPIIDNKDDAVEDIEIIEEDFIEDEVINESAEDFNAPEEATESEAAPIEIEELSYRSAVQKFLSTPAVFAQEVITEEIKSLDDLGDFKSATINFSLAFGDISNYEEIISESENFSNNAMPFANSSVIGDISGIASTSNNNIFVVSTTSPSSPPLRQDYGDQEGYEGQAVFETGFEGDAGADDIDSNVEIINLDEDVEIEKTEVDIAEINEAGTVDDISEQEDIINLVIEEIEAPELIVEEIEKEFNEEEIVENIIESIKAPELIIENIIEESAADLEISDESEDNSVSKLFRKLIDINTAQAQDEYLRDAKLIVWYSLDWLAASGTTIADNSEVGTPTDERIWHRLDVLSGEELSNSLSGGYLSYSADFLNSWDDIDGLKIKLEGVVGEDEGFVAYLDSVWVEAEYESESELERLEKRKRWEEALDLLSKQLVFMVDEEGEMKFRYNKNENRIWDTLEEILGLGNFWEDVDIRAELLDGSGHRIDLPLTIVFEEDGEFTIRLPESPRGFKPGKYSIRFYIVDSSGESSEYFELNQEFRWGVIAVNTNRSVYTPLETAYIQIAVLDDFGHTICDADLNLKITAPGGSDSFFDTRGGSIVMNPACGPDNVISVPDYYVYYDTAGEGTYLLELSADTISGSTTVFDGFEVKADISFEIERVGPTRIFPWVDYSMSINIKANEDFSGDISEVVPDSFKIKSRAIEIKNPLTGEYIDYNLTLRASSSQAVFKEEKIEQERILSWENIEIFKDDRLRIIYTFDAPNISPELYLLGPLKVISAQGGPAVGWENRKWQIAADANVAVLLTENIALDTGTSLTSEWITIASSSSASFTGGETYFVYVTAGFAGNAAGVSTDFEILYGNDVQYTGYVEAPAAAGYEAQQISWFDVYTQPVTAKDIGIRYQTNSGTSYAFNTQIITINLSDVGSANWKYASNTTSYPHTTTMNPRASITLDQADGFKDWLVFGMEEVEVNDDTRNFEGEIYDGAASYMLYSREGENTGDLELLPYTLFRPFNDVVADTVFSMRVRDDQVGVHTHAKSRIFALNLDRFESHKTTSSALSIDMGNWTNISNLNDGGNYAPQTDGNQLIFASWADDVAAVSARYDDRLLVDSVVSPADWGWTQSAAATIIGRVSYDATDRFINNIVTQASISTAGVPISLDVDEVASTNQVAWEANISAFSVKLKSIFPPLGVFATTTARTDASGIVDVSFEVDDDDLDDLRVKLEYTEGSDCTYYLASSSSLTGGVSASYGTPAIDNDHPYQIGTTSNMIETNSGTNTIEVDWDSLSDLPNGNNTYCLWLTANDTSYDQDPLATTTVVIDNLDPTAPIALTYDTRTGTTVTFAINVLGATTTETNFLEYIIYYKSYDGTDPTEANTPFASTSDINLFDKFFNSEASTTITGLNPKQKYSFAIWAYDEYGNKASSSRTDVTTNDAPSGGFNFSSIGQRTDGSGIVDISIEVDDDNNDTSCQAKIEYVKNASCDFSGAVFDPTLDENSITMDSGSVAIDNDWPYQVGTSSFYITTQFGANNITFDWLSKIDESDASSTFCLRLTVFDGLDDQLVSTTTTLMVDNFNPTAPGTLLDGGSDTDSIKLIFAATSSDSNEPAADAYKIFYKKSVSGVVDYVVGDNLEHDDAALDTYIFTESSTTISGLEADTEYYINIWAYDAYGNKATSTEISIWTNSTLSNSPISFINPYTDNIALAGTSTEWIFRAVVTDTDGYGSLATTTIRLADNTDNITPFNDLQFYWDQTENEFYENGVDALSAASISANSSSTCALNTCTLDFKILFNKTFTSHSTNYDVEVLSGNDSGKFDFDSYPNVFQVRFPYVEQIHYRWRNDDGGE